MKDEKGLYYYPFPGNKQVRMYIQEKEGAIWFRMWNEKDPEMWLEHGWVPYDAIKQAAEMSKSKGKGFDPNLAYDENAAKLLLKMER